MFKWSTITLTAGKPYGSVCEDLDQEVHSSKFRQETSQGDKFHQETSQDDKLWEGIMQWVKDNNAMEPYYSEGLPTKGYPYARDPYPHVYTPTPEFRIF